MRPVLDQRRSAPAPHRPIAIAIGLAAILATRGITAIFLPLAFDEAYYWTWSKRLALGYYDHPPLIAYCIRAGTAIFGDTPAGVRFVPSLLSLVATWAVWRSAVVITGRADAGPIAALLYNATLMAGVQTLVATPDAPAMAASAGFLLALAHLATGGRGSWWVVAGVAAGFALLSKYTGLFLGAGVLLWLARCGEPRRWLATPWPYLGALIAAGMIAPNLFWNARHDWVSVSKQLGRIGASDGFTLRFIGEFVAVQLALATPFICVLMVAGLGRSFATRSARPPIALLGCMVVPAFLYFCWHALHARVEGNWPSFLYPALGVAAALAWTQTETDGSSRGMRAARACAVPVALAMTAIVYVQAFTGLVPMRPDPLARLLAVGYTPVAEEVEALRVREGAAAILTTSYAHTAWLSFHLPPHATVVQFDERRRWSDLPVPDVRGPLLYFTVASRDRSATLERRFDHVTPIAEIARRWGGRDVEQYRIYRVTGAEGPLFRD